MIILKMLEKLVLFPVWIILVMISICIKVSMHVYSIVKGFFSLLLILLVIGTIVCYRDWIQVAFLLCLEAAAFLILAFGCFVEVIIDMLKGHVTDRLLS